MDYQKVLRHFGTRYQLAKALGISHQAVYVWKGTIPTRYHKQLKLLMRRKWVHSYVSRAQAAQDAAGGTIS